MGGENDNDDDLKCNWAVICQDDCCPHFRPHLTHPVNPYKHPQCEDKNTFCYTEERAVNCVPVLGVKTTDYDALDREAKRLENGV